MRIRWSWKQVQRNSERMAWAESRSVVHTEGSPDRTGLGGSFFASVHSRQSEQSYGTGHETEET